MTLLGTRCMVVLERGLTTPQNQPLPGRRQGIGNSALDTCGGVGRQRSISECLETGEPPFGVERDLDVQKASRPVVLRLVDMDRFVPRTTATLESGTPVNPCEGMSSVAARSCRDPVKVNSIPKLMPSGSMAPVHAPVGTSPVCSVSAVRVKASGEPW